MIEFKNAPPKWGNAGTEPLPEEIESGYVAKDKIPAPYHNFYLHRTGECVEELQNKLSNENTDRVNSETAINETITAHKNDKANPHNVTKEQLGLDKVDNTADSEKRVEYANSAGTSDFSSEAGVSRKVQNALTVRFNGGDTESTDKWTFDGSTTRNVNITPAKIGAAKTDLSNVEDDVFKNKAQSVGAIGVTIVNGTSTDGVAYTANVEGFEIEVGKVISFIPNMTSTSKQTTLNLNGMGAIRIYQGLTSQTSPMVSANNDNWLSEKRPILLVYHETTNSVGTVTKCWKTVATRPTNEDVYGTIEVEQGGTGATTAEEALDNLGVPCRSGGGDMHGIVLTSYLAPNGTYTDGNEATGYLSIAGGYNCKAEDFQCVALGEGTKANGQGCSAINWRTIAKGVGQAAFGKYNVEYDGATSETDTTGSIFIVGVGTTDTARANAFRITSTGKCMGSQSFSASGADYAEYFEWIDGNPNKEDRRGYFVTLDGIKIRKANAEDNYILGVISATPSVIGNAYTDMWHGMYLTDIYGERLTEVVDVPETTDEETGKVIPAHTETRFIINPDYDPTEKYVGRDERKEWSLVGTHGQLVVVDDGSCEVNGYCKVADGGKAVKSTEKTEYRVIERLDDTHIRIYIK